ncbi:uncharacterized protein N7484_005932 [Penicillium longicatenatum]|uniref:uncharacterized protein n=1 Tax=Penicillium longicatenatum TaxID=1561947 RepID=UPI002549B4F1|nr:uncharacterized protein N7484_005932 [Penicillium longicatenatum]KAJ5643425.1 hypothetical protein N7484_005932 [Penicillium longicatenatum]
MPQSKDYFDDSESLEMGNQPPKPKRNAFLRICGTPWRELSTLELCLRILGWLTFWVVVGVIIGLIIRYTK